jgi:hypothetical protein
MSVAKIYVFYYYNLSLDECVKDKSFLLNVLYD